MKRNYFGDPIAQPGDDLMALFMDRYMPDVDVTLFGRFIEHDDLCGWSATVEDEDGNSIEVHDFESEEELRAYLVEQDVEIDE